MRKCKFGLISKDFKKYLHVNLSLSIYAINLDKNPEVFPVLFPTKNGSRLLKKEKKRFLEDSVLDMHLHVYEDF